MPRRHVEIHGQRYAIRSELDPQNIGELAAYLDEKMRAAARELASDRPASHCRHRRAEHRGRVVQGTRRRSGADGRVRARAAEIERLVDAVLDEAEHGG